MFAQADQVLRMAVGNELRRRASAMSNMLDFTRFTFPKYVVNWHHKLICSKLDDVLSGKIKRLMIFTPPRHGKTELIGRRFPAYAFGRNPDVKMVSTSYSADLVGVTNRDVQRIIDDEQYKLLFPDTKLFGENVRDNARGMYLRNTDEFEIVNHRGYYRSVGVMGGLTGRGFGIGIIDDPIKDRLEAGSPTYRNRVWDWYNSVFFTRRENDNAAIIVVQTRWHQEDLAGKLLEGAGEDTEKWDVVSLPALMDGASHPVDTRSDGEALWPSLFNRGALLSIKKQIGSYEWAALYQQRPAPREGGMISTKMLLRGIIDELPSNYILGSVRYWDKAGTAGSGCYSAGVLIHEMRDHTFVVADVVYGQWGALEREERIRNHAKLDGQQVRVWTEQEPGSGGKESAEATIRGLAGFTAKADKVTGSKETRAEPFAAQVEGGNVFILKREWTKEFIDECGSFPNGRFKDCVDAATGAFNKLVAGRINPSVGSGRSSEEDIARMDREIREALDKLPESEQKELQETMV